MSLLLKLTALKPILAHNRTYIIDDKVQIAQNVMDYVSARETANNNNNKQSKAGHLQLFRDCSIPSPCKRKSNCSRRVTNDTID